MTDPLISYLVPCFNEEKYLEAAIDCAFNQTYGNLEIILSDNGSTDRTFEIMQDLSAGYQGQHTVRVIQQPDHCNVCEHTNRLMHDINGAYVVHASGDDLQDPRRTDEIAKVWRETGASMIGNNLIKVDAEAKKAVDAHRDPNQQYSVTLEEILDRGPHNACTGAAQAWDPRLFDLYGPLPDWYHTADLLVPFWGALENGCAFISEPLTFFRVTGENTGLGSQHMMADEEGRLVLEEKMSADTVSQLMMMMRTIQNNRTRLAQKYDCNTLENIVAQNIFRCAAEWADARDVLERRQAKAA